jgi:hypothetical protein
LQIPLKIEGRGLDVLVARRQALLACGVASSLWYMAINVLVPLQWPEYSVLHQTVSELSAVDAPTRSLWVAIVVPYVVLFAAFGAGVLASAGNNRALRVAGWLILFYCVFNAWWPPMHGREVLAAGGATLSDTLHLVWAGVTTVLFLLTMACSAVAFPGRFRRYTVLGMVLLVLFGLLTSLAAPAVAHNLPTPWIGVWERIDVGVFLIWVAAFAVLLRRRRVPPLAAGESV